MKASTYFLFLCAFAAFLSCKKSADNSPDDDYHVVTYKLTTGPSNVPVSMRFRVPDSETLKSAEDLSENARRVWETEIRVPKRSLPFEALVNAHVQHVDLEDETFSLTILVDGAVKATQSWVDSPVPIGEITYLLK